MNILTLDLSLVATGWAWSMDSLASYGLITAKGLDGIQRIAHIAMRIATDARHADVVVLEGPSLHSQGRGTCDRWALRGVVLHELYLAGKPFVEIPPSSLKQFATGKGNANKDAMIAAAIRSFGFEGSDNNEADAWLLLAMAEAHYDGADVPAYRAAALAKIAWPEVTP